MKYYKSICYCQNCKSNENKNEYYLLTEQEKNNKILCSNCKKQIDFEEIENFIIKEPQNKINPFNKMIFNPARRHKKIQWDK